MADINWDDDEEVEKYKRKQAQRAEASEKKAELKRNANATDDSLLVEIIKKAEQVVSNIEQGYSASALDTLHIIFSEPLKLAQKASVAFIAAKKDLRESPEVKLLKKLCEEDEDICGPSEFLCKLMLSGQYKNLGLAVPAIVEEGVKNGVVKPQDASRLKDLYSMWLKDVPWSTCELSATNRPSLASWDGYPWDMDQITRKHLRRGIVGTNAAIHTSYVSIEAPCCKLLWKEGVGRSEDIAKIVHEAFDERKAEVSTQQQKKTKKAGAAGEKMTSSGSEHHKAKKSRAGN